MIARRDSFESVPPPWSEPALVEPFADGTWVERWVETLRGQFAIHDGRLVSCREEACFLLYKPWLHAGVAVELDGMMLPGCAPGDVSIVWTENDVFSGSSPQIFGLRRLYGLQVGALSNSRSGIFDNLSVCMAGSPFTLEPGRTYRIRAEIEERFLRLFVDGALLCEARETFPLGVGRVALYAHYAGKAFSNVRISTRGVQARVSPIVVGDAFYRRGDLSEACRQYAIIAESHAGRALGEEARYKQAVCSSLTANGEQARLLFSTLTHPVYKGLAALHAADDRFERSDHAAVLGLLRDLYRDTPELTQEICQRWAHYVGRLMRTEPLRSAAYLGLRDELFRDDTLTSPIAAHALLSCGRFGEVLERHPCERVECGLAHLYLGSLDKVAAEYADVAWLRNEALLRLGRFSEIAVHSDLYPFVLVFENRVEDALLEAPYEPLIAIYAGRVERVLASEHVPPQTRAAALVLAGRLHDAAALGDTRALLRLGRVDEALARAPSVDELRQVRYLRALVACSSGDKEAFARERKALGDLPVSLRWPDTWFCEHVVVPFLDERQGQKDALGRSLHAAARMWKECQRLAYFAGRVLGEISREAFHAQPDRRFIPSREALADALALERSGRSREACERYRAWTELPAELRMLEDYLTSPALDGFVAWRIEELS